MFNLAQMQSLLRAVLLIICGILIARGKMTGDQATNLIDTLVNDLPTVITFGTCIMTVATTAWGLLSQTDKARLLSVARMRGVTRIIVDKDAPVDEAPHQLAANPDVKEVVFPPSPQSSPTPAAKVVK